MQVKLVNILTYDQILSYEKWCHYPIIPTGMRSNIKGRWQPGYQCESFHWSVIYTVCVVCAQPKSRISKVFGSTIEVINKSSASAEVADRNVTWYVL